MRDIMVRVVIATTALALAAVKLFRPEIKVDLTLLAFIAIAALAMLGPKYRIKGLDLGGFKVEFEQKPKPEIPVTAAPPATLQPSMPFPDTAADHYLERLVKFAPTEVIGAYAVVMAMLLSPSNELHVPALLWVVFAAFLIATPFYLQTVVRVLRVQALFSAVAFAAWALILPGPFATIPHYDPVYGALAFIVVNFLLPLLYPGARTE